MVFYTGSANDKQRMSCCQQTDSER